MSGNIGRRRGKANVTRCRDVLQLHEDRFLLPPTWNSIGAVK